MALELRPFWETKSLSQMNDTEWESLCDGCGQCCLLKLENEETNELYFTNVICKLFNITSCSCSDYTNRVAKVSGCVVLRPYNKTLYSQLPTSCAYRLLSEGKKIPTWHPLITNNKNSVHESGISVQLKVISEEFIHPDELEDHIIGKL